MDLPSNFYEPDYTHFGTQTDRHQLSNPPDQDYLLQTLRTPTEVRHPLWHDVRQRARLNHNELHDQPQQSGFSAEGVFRNLFSKIFSHLLVLSVVFWNHPSGILVVAGLEIAMWLANAYLVYLANKDILKRTVAGRDLNIYSIRLQVAVLVGTMYGLVWLICNYGLQESFWQVLSLSLPSYWEPTFYMVVWVTILLDYFMLFFIIGIKGIVCMMPDFVLRTLGKSYSYAGIELIAQLYRNILPIRPWFNFLIGWIVGGSYVIGTLCFVFYFLVKIIILFGFLVMFAGAAIIIYAIVKAGILQDDNNLRRPTLAELSAVQNCSVCIDSFKNPVILGCKHIFCEDCIVIWCSKNNSCPLCRQPVNLIGDHLLKQWGTGATEFDHSFY